MTDKQIIIDGVDVSGCIHYEEYFEEDEDIKIKDFCALWYNSCHSCNNHTCYYKQLARKEQECEELKNIINEAKNAGIDLKSFLLSEAIQKEYEEQIDKLKATNKQVEQKLERIREASKRDKDFCLKCNGDVEIDCIECIEGGRALLAKEILKIIDEVE